MQTISGCRFATEQQDDEIVLPYMEQLTDGRNYSQDQTHDGESNELRITGTEEQQNDESGTLEERKIRGPTLLKNIWKLPPGKTLVVPFNSRNQAIGKDDRKLASFLGIVARTPQLTSLHINDWRRFGKDEKKKLVEFVRRRSQTNRNNRAKQKMPHMGGSKSIATLIDEKDMINEKLSNNDVSDGQPPRSIAWEGDVYSQVLGNEKTAGVERIWKGNANMEIPSRKSGFDFHANEGHVTCSDGSNKNTSGASNNALSTRKGLCEDGPHCCS
ncbi:hypothetical protein HAX54_007718 [Datura stramonium]|uniref:Uncharacterized protein n=1 Tax=Datura stramonium TaxID=4076 RepID=A0ABS8TCB9_DATST|nr:hypothetical protein [Datura stramonium]